MATINKVLFEACEEDNGETFFVYVMAEGVADDVAVYYKRVNATLVYPMENRTGYVVDEIVSGGHKLTEREALAKMSIPNGKHYRR